MKAINNIDCIRIPIAENTNNYYLPYSTNFSDKKIDRIMIAGILGDNENVLNDLVTGVSIIPSDVLGSCFLTLKSTDGKFIFRDVPLNFGNVNNTVNQLEVNSIIDFSTSFIRFRDDSVLENVNGYELLIYVIYESKYDAVENYDTIMRVIVPPTSEAPAQKKLSYFIDGQYGKLVRLDFTPNNNEYVAKNFFLNLVDKQGRTFDTVNSAIFATLSSPSDVTATTRMFGFLPIDKFDVDYNASTIWYEHTENNLYLNFYFTNN